MLQKFQRCGWLLLLVLLVLGVPAGWAWSPIGPVGNGGDAWQTPSIGYGNVPICIGSGYVGAPKNLGEEYRWNQPTLFYAFDQNFLEYFGSNGVATIDQAFVLLSNHLSAADLTSWSPNLTEFSLNTSRINYRAQALDILDLKAVVIRAMMEQLGLADPVEWVWTLRERHLPVNATCPAYLYSVIQRNFDIVAPQVSKYINGTLFTYEIQQGNCADCDNAITDNTPVDPYAITPTAVASGLFFNPGIFYTGLTRDDMAGLRYLMTTNNLNVEGVDANSTLVSGGFIDRNTQQLLKTLDLHTFVSALRTNDDAALLVLYPGLTFNGPATAFFTNVVTTNTVYYYKNYPYDPAGTPAHLVSVATYSTNVETWYNHNIFGLVTNNFYTNSVVNIYTTNISASACGPYSIPGQICTNISVTSVLTNGIFGDFYIVPTNLCGVSIVSTQLIKPIYITNLLAVATNGASAFGSGSTNTGGTSNILGQQFTQNLVYSYNQYTFIVNPLNCQATGYTTNAALRQGINRMFFVRHDYDSLLGQYWSPVTNSYQLTAVQGNQLAPQIFRRTVSQPDILFTAQDLGFTGNGAVILFSRSVNNFDTTHVLPNLAGPGNITGPISLSFNKVGTVYRNRGPNFLTEIDATSTPAWGKYDLSTNEPVVFPNGTDITALENQVLMQIVTTNALPGALPDATRGAAYAPIQLTGNGGAPPYSWSLASFSLSGWPTGIVLNAQTGVISSGTNTVAAANVPGIYDITVQMTDAGGRSVVRDFTLTVH